MEGTVIQQPPSPFAGDFSGLTPVSVEEGTTIETTAGTTEQTTVAAGTTEETTNPEGTSEETTTPEGESRIIDTLRTQYGIEDVLDESIEGVHQLIDKVSEKAKADAIAAKFQARPILGELDAHLEAGKSLESFFEVKEVQANKITLPTLTGEEKADAQIKQYFKDVIKANYKAQGLSDKQVGRIIESAELENTLEDDAKEATTAWNSRIDQQAQQITQSEEKARLQAIEDDKQMVIKINTLIDAGKLNGAIIPTADRQPLKDFMLKADDKGFTPRDYAFAKLSLEQQAIIDYLVFKDFKLKGFVAPTVASLDSLKGDNKLVNNQGGGGGNAAEVKPLPSFDFNKLNKQ